MIEPDISNLCTALSLRIRHGLPGPSAQETMLPPWRTGRLDPRVEYRSAAVLLLLFPHNGHILFPLIRRSERLRNHQGQIALPGGALEAGEDPVSAALRESEEELGIDGKSVRVLGSLTPFAVDVSKFIVSPVVGAVSFLPPFRPSPDEVADYFTVSLSEILDSRSETTMELQRDGQIHRVPCFSFSGNIVWGATAMALAEFKALCELTNWHTETDRST